MDDRDALLPRLLSFMGRVPAYMHLHRVWAHVFAVDVIICRRSAASARCEVMLVAKVLFNVTCGVGLARPSPLIGPSGGLYRVCTGN